jgi:hypothetical protein
MKKKIKTKFSLFAEIKKEINRVGMSSEENNTIDESITKPVCLYVNVLFIHLLFNY